VSVYWSPKEIFFLIIERAGDEERFAILTKCNVIHTRVSVGQVENESASRLWKSDGVQSQALRHIQGRRRRSRAQVPPNIVPEHRNITLADRAGICSESNPFWYRRPWSPGNINQPCKPQKRTLPGLLAGAQWQPGGDACILPAWHDPATVKRIIPGMLDILAYTYRRCQITGQWIWNCILTFGNGRGFLLFAFFLGMGAISIMNLWQGLFENSTAAFKVPEPGRGRPAKFPVIIHSLVHAIVMCIYKNSKWMEWMLFLKYFELTLNECFEPIPSLQPGLRWSIVR